MVKRKDEKKSDRVDQLLRVEEDCVVRKEFVVQILRCCCYIMYGSKICGYKWIRLSSVKGIFGCCSEVGDDCSLFC